MKCIYCKLKMTPKELKNGVLHKCDKCNIVYFEPNHKEIKNG